MTAIPTDPVPIVRELLDPEDLLEAGEDQDMQSRVMHLELDYQLRVAEGRAPQLPEGVTAAIIGLFILEREHEQDDDFVKGAQRLLQLFKDNPDCETLGDLLDKGVVRSVAGMPPEPVLTWADFEEWRQERSNA